MRELIVLGLLCLGWGFHFVVLKVAMGEISPLFYAAIRMTIVAAVMAPFLRWRSGGDHDRGSMFKVLAAGVCLGGLNYAFMFSGLKLATASSSAVAMEMYVPFATILSVVFLGEKIGWKRSAGIFLAFCGIAIIALGKTDDPGTNIQLGVALVAGGALMEAIGAILVKKSSGFKPHELLAWFAVVGSVTLWALSFAFGDANFSALEGSDLNIIGGSLIYSVLAGSIFGHTAYYWLIQRLPISLVAPSILLTTLLAVTFGVLLLGDPFGPRFIIGGLLTLLGVGVVVFRTPANSAKPASGSPILPVEVFSEHDHAATPDPKEAK